MLTGFVNKDNGNKIYYGNDGKQKYGEEKINNNWYYFDEKTGNLTTGFVELPSKIVYYNPDGTMHYGELLYEGHWYYFDLLTGAMQTGFLQLPSKVVYYDLKTGQMLYGKQ